jgi:hypothetical protein
VEAVQKREKEGCCIIPLVDDKSHNLNDVDNYRATTLITIVCEVFKHVMKKS